MRKENFVPLAIIGAVLFISLVLAANLNNSTNDSSFACKKDCLNASVNSTHQCNAIYKNFMNTCSNHKKFIDCLFLGSFGIKGNAFTV